MTREINWVLGPLAVAVAFIFIAPAFAAPADKTVALTNTSSRLHSTIDSGEAAEIVDPDSVATRAPARLSPLAGNDDIAWQSANSIHVPKVQRIKFKRL
ncbi:MAG TPA: hypothetical protein VGT78_03805 [Rhizomicrobium sp.]|nr:hypothetical protein [Rhizomicrobium sp.]